jgi:hypothetical protein
MQKETSNQEIAPNLASLGGTVTYFMSLNIATRSISKLRIEQLTNKVDPSKNTSIVEDLCLLVMPFLAAYVVGGITTSQLKPIADFLSRKELVRDVLSSLEQSYKNIENNKRKILISSVVIAAVLYATQPELSPIFTECVITLIMCKVIGEAVKKRYEKSISDSNQQEKRPEKPKIFVLRDQSETWKSTFSKNKQSGPQL